MADRRPRLNLTLKTECGDFWVSWGPRNLVGEGDETGFHILCRVKKDDPESDWVPMKDISKEDYEVIIDELMKRISVSVLAAEILMTSAS